MNPEEAKRRAGTGPLMLLARRGFAVLIGFISTITIARLVSPRDFGLANMSAVILALAQMFRDFGLTSAVLRKGKVSQAELTFLFWFNAATTMVLALLIALASPLAGIFYKEPVVTWVILASLGGFIVGGVSLQHRSLMTREMRFGEIALIDAASLGVNFAVSLGLALLYRNVWAIVGGSVAQSVTSSTLYFWRAKWKPGRPVRTEGMRELFKFGLNTSIFSLSTFISNNIAQVLIGHVMGSSALGQYNRAQSLYGIPTYNVIQPIAQATMPLLTHLRVHPESYREAYLQLVRKLCTFLLPFSVALTFGATPLVMMLLGARWQPAGAVLTCLAPTLAAVAFGYAVSDLFVTQDRSAELRSLGLYEVALRVAAIATGARFGLIGVSLGFTVSTIAVCLIRMMVAGARGPVSRRDQLGAATPALPLAVGSLLGCVAALVVNSRLGLGWVGECATIFGLSGLTSLIGGLSTSSSRAALLELAHTFQPPGRTGKLPGARNVAGIREPSA